MGNEKNPITLGFRFGQSPVIRWIIKCEKVPNPSLSILFIYSYFTDHYNLFI